MNLSYRFELTKKQKMVGFSYLALHSLFFLNIAADFVFFHL